MSHVKRRADAELADIDWEAFDTQFATAAAAPMKVDKWTPRKQYRAAESSSSSSSSAAAAAAAAAPPPRPPPPTALVSTMEDESEDILLDCVYTHANAKLVWEYANGPSFVSRFVLDSEQRRVLSAIQGGYHTFCTGEAGTGKSLALKEAVNTHMLGIKTAHIMASTAVAAQAVGGCTFHSWMGIGLGAEPGQPMARMVDQRIRFMKTTTKERMLTATHAVIDEVIMIKGEDWALADKVCQKVRDDDRPFGGIVVYAFGDPLQLPPIKGEFAFDTLVWKRMFKHQYQLTVPYRQLTDKPLLDGLNDLRYGGCSDTTLQTFRATEANVLKPPDGIKPSTLWSLKKNVNLENNAELEKLPGKARPFIAVDHTASGSSDKLNASQAVEILRLKEGAQVICIKNGSIEGVVNGDKGVVIGFEKHPEMKGDDTEYPVVYFENDVFATVVPAKFEIDPVKNAAGDTISSDVRIQLPINLAWHLTIHKSQGQTINWLVVMCEGAFECAQIYVAVSRGRSLARMRVVGLKREHVKADDRAVQWMRKTFGMAPPLDPSRRMCITASAMNLVLGTNKYVGKDLPEKERLAMQQQQALAQILGLAIWKKIPAAEEGKKMEYTIGLNFEGRYKEEDLGPPAIHTQPLFSQHSVLRFIGASADRELIDEKTQEVIGGVEIKYRAGWRKDKPVELERYGGDPNYRDQCFTQMFVRNWPRNFLAVQSDVNLDHWEYKWDINWWKKEAAPKVLPFYDERMRWYWENDRSDAAMAYVRAFVNSSQKLHVMSVITKLFDQRPSPSDLAIMKQWRASRNARASAAA